MKKEDLEQIYNLFFGKMKSIEQIENYFNGRYTYREIKTAINSKYDESYATCSISKIDKIIEKARDAK